MAVDINKHILITVDNTETSHRAVHYVAAMFGGRRGLHVRLWLRGSEH